MNGPVRMISEGQQNYSFSRRAMLLGGIQASLGLVLAGRMTWLSVYENDKYKLLSESNRVNLTLTPPRRGWIVDRRGVPIANNRTDFRVDIIPDRLENKKPADVLARAIEFRAKLDRLLAEHGMAPTKRYPRGAGRVTPSVVFLNSGLLLDAVVGWIIANTAKRQLVSPFYAHHAFSGKTPSDVFGMVDLANRRIDRILATAESCHFFVQEPINCSTP